MELLPSKAVPEHIKRRGWKPSYKTPKGHTELIHSVWIPECPVSYITAEAEAITAGWSRARQLFKAMGISSTQGELLARDEMIYLALSSAEAHADAIEQIRES